MLRPRDSCGALCAAGGARAGGAPAPPPGAFVPAAGCAGLGLGSEPPRQNPERKKKAPPEKKYHRRNPPQDPAHSARYRIPQDGHGAGGDAAALRDADATRPDDRERVCARRMGAAEFLKKYDYHYTLLYATIRQNAPFHRTWPGSRPPHGTATIWRGGSARRPRFGRRRAPANITRTTAPAPTAGQARRPRRLVLDRSQEDPRRTATLHKAAADGADGGATAPRDAAARRHAADAAVIPQEYPHTPPQYDTIQDKPGWWAGAPPDIEGGAGIQPPNNPHKTHNNQPPKKTQQNPQKIPPQKKGPAGPSRRLRAQSQPSAARSRNEIIKRPSKVNPKSVLCPIFFRPSSALGSNK